MMCIREPIIHSTFINAEPETVFDHLATAEGLDKWFTSGTQLDPRPGGEIRFRWTDWGPDRISGEDGGEILEYEKPRRFVFQWRPDQPDFPTTVELELHPRGAGTVVRLSESGYRNTPAGLRCILDCAAGWGEALTLCKFFVEHGIRY